jgi:hypothetical protein
MGRGGTERHPGTFAQQRADIRDWREQLSRHMQRITGFRKNPYADLPNITQYSLTPEMQQRAEELWNSEQLKPILQRASYSDIVRGLLNGTIV